MIINETKLSLDETAKLLAKVRKVEKSKYIIMSLIFASVAVFFIVFGAIRNDTIIWVMGTLIMAFSLGLIILFIYIVFLSSEKGIKFKLKKKDFLASGIDNKYEFKANDFQVIHHNENDGVKNFNYQDVVSAIYLDNILYLYMANKGCYLVDLKSNNEDEKKRLVAKLLPVIENKE